MGKILLVVDMQNGFMTKNIYFDLKKKINNLIKSSKYDYYIFTKFVNNKKCLYFSQLHWHDFLDEKSQKICVDIPLNSIVFKKNSYGLSQKDIRKIKKLLSKEKEIDICGLQTDACVYAISLQLFDNGIYPNILINYTATENDFKVIKSILEFQFGKVDERG